MGSSSDIEFVQKPAEGRGARTRRAARPRAEVPSPAAKRVSAKVAPSAAPTAKTTKGKGKARSQAFISDEEEDDSDADLLPAPGPRKRSPAKAAVVTTLEIPTSSTAPVFSSDPPAASLGAQLPRSASTSAAAGPSKRAPASTSQPSLKSVKSRDSPAPARPDMPKSSSAPIVNNRVPPPKKVLKLGGESSEDETDDFFTRRPAAATQPKRVPGRRPASSLPAGSSVGRPGPRKMVASASSDSSDSDSARSRSSSIEPEDRDPSLAAAVKHSKLPEWTRNVGKATLGLSGSAAKMGNKPNRKKRRLDIDSDEEAKLEAEEKARKVALEAAEDTDDSFASGSDMRKRKGKGKSAVELERDATRSPTPVAVETRSLKDIIAEAKLTLSSPNRGTRPTSNPFISSDSHSDHHSDDDDDDDDTSHLDPELLRIRNAARAAAALPPSDDDLHVVGAAVRESSMPMEEDQEEQLTTIRVCLVMDPERTVSEVAKRGYERVMPVEIGMKQSFEYLFQSIGTLRTIQPDSLVLTYRRNRIYPFGTPHSLKIHPDIGADFKGYTMEVWEKMEAARKEGRVLGAPAEETPVASQEASGPAAAAGGDDDDEQEGGQSQLFRITIRGSATQSVALAVKPSTLISSLLSKYCKKFSIPDDRQKRMWLEFDGDRLDSGKKLEDYEGEIEDEETVDVGEAKG